MLIPFNMGRDINGFQAYAPPFSDNGKKVFLTANVEQNFTVPYTQDSTYPNVIALFSFEPGGSVWVANNSTAELPTSSFTDTKSCLNPQARFVKGGDVLSFITSNAQVEVGVEFYAVP